MRLALALSLEEAQKRDQKASVPEVRDEPLRENVDLQLARDLLDNSLAKIAGADPDVIASTKNTLDRMARRDRFEKPAALTVEKLFPGGVADEEAAEARQLLRRFHLAQDQAARYNKDLLRADRILDGISVLAGVDGEAVAEARKIIVRIANRDSRTPRVAVETLFPRGTEAEREAAVIAQVRELNRLMHSAIRFFAGMPPEGSQGTAPAAVQPVGASGPAGRVLRIHRSPAAASGGNIAPAGAPPGADGPSAGEGGGGGGGGAEGAAERLRTMYRQP